MSQLLTYRGFLRGRFGGQAKRESPFRIRLARGLHKFSRAAKHPVVWVATALVICLPAAAFRVLATASSNPQMSDLLQTVVRLLALALVLPLNLN